MLQLFALFLVATASCRVTTVPIDTDPLSHTTPGLPLSETIKALPPPALHEALLALTRAPLSRRAAPSITFSNSFGDGMVLQRGAPITVWGFLNGLSPGTQITVNFNGVQIKTTADPQLAGFWSAVFPAMNASLTAHQLTADAGSVVKTIHNVLIGDVFLCGGQSNMQFTVSQEVNATGEIHNASKYPNIRLFTVGQGSTSEVPMAMFGTIRQPWSVPSAQSVGGPDWQIFSAVCWEFGRQLSDTLGNSMPIGLISSNWGGTPIQSWMRPHGLAACPNAPTLSNGTAPYKESVLFNAMLAPLAHTRFAGMLWYQGENNVPDNVGGPSAYECLFPAFINDLRAAFAQPLPFLFVQLSAYNSGFPNNALAVMRLIQVASTAKLASVGYAISADIGNPTAKFGDIHPDDKITLGKRLLLAAENVIYNNHMHSFKGPHPVLLQRNGTGVTVGFASNSKFPNVDIRPSLYHCGVPPIKLEACEGFAANVQGSWVKCANPTHIATAGSGFFFVDCGLPASAVISQIRYGYADWPIMTLYNRAGDIGSGIDGLPAEPFVMDMPAQE